MLSDIRRAFQRWSRRGRLPPPVTLVGAASLSKRLPLTHQDAAQRLINRDVCRSVAYRNRLLKASEVGSHPDLLKFSKGLLKELQARGYPFFPNEYLRDKSRQDSLYKAGFSRAKFGHSAHNYGMAVDIVHFVRLWDLTRKEWAVIGAIGKDVARRQNIKITWGGDFKSIYDPAHWELADWKERLASELR